MRLRRVGGISLFAVGAVLLSGWLGSGTSRAVAPETTPAATAGANPSTSDPQVAASTPIVSAATEDAPAVARPEIIAHRGDRSGAAANTPGAVARAMANGADSVEFDIVTTADNALVVMHDNDLDRNTVNCTGRASEKTYRHLRKCRTSDGGQVPNVKEMLREIPAGKRVYLHLKTPAGRGLADRLMAAVDAHGLNEEGRAVFFSSHRAVLDELQELGANYLGLIFDNRAASWAWTSDYQVLIPYQTPVTAKLVRAAHRRGQVVVTVQSHPVTLQDAGRLRVDGVMADDLGDALQTFG
ncbi:MAG: glycerophosphodiester phosphodiesterase [Sporichthyaceae bacterium]